MSYELYPRSSYSTGNITKADHFDLEQMAAGSAKATEIAKIAGREIAQVGTHAVGAMAEVTRAANDVQRRLTMEGYRSEVNDDANSKVLQVTGHNLITLANTAQKEILQQAAGLMR